MRKRGLGLFLAFSYLIVFGGSVYSQRLLSLRVLFHLLVTGWLGVWLIRRLRRRQGLPVTELDGPIALWLVAGLLTAFLGQSVRFSLERVWLTLIYGLSFYVLVGRFRRGSARPIMVALFLAAGLVSLMALFEWLSWYVGFSFLPRFVHGWIDLGGWRRPIPPVFYRLNSTLGGATPLAGFLALVIPPCVGWMVTVRERQARIGLGMLALGLFVAEVLAFSRGGVVALAASLPLTGLGWLAAHAHWRERIRQRVAAWRWWVWAAVALGLAVIVALGSFWLWRSFHRGMHSTRFRFTLWGVALEEFLGRPLMGVGPANFGRALLRLNNGSLPRRQIGTAHNVYLNTLAEQGLVGVAAGGWLLIAAVRAGLCRWRSAQSPAVRVRIAACGAALVGFGAHQLVDTFYTPAHWLPVLIFGAYALTDRRRAVTSRPRPRAVGILGALVLLGLSAVGLIWTDAAQVHFQRSVRLADAGELDIAAERARSAQRMDPALALYDFQLATVRARQALEAGTDVATESAIAAYRVGLAQEPVWGRQTVNLAALYWAEGRPAEAIEWLERSVEADPDPLYWVNLGLYYEETGHLMQAWEAYAEALVERPDWAGSGFWTASSSRAAAWDEIERRVAETMTEAPERRRADYWSQFAWSRGDLAALERQAHALVEAAPQSPVGYVWLSRAHLARGAVAEAEAAAERAVELGPNHSPALAARGCARAEAGALEAAGEDLTLAIFLSSRTDEAFACLGEVRLAEGDTAGAISAYQRALPVRAISQDVEVTLYGRFASFDLLPNLVRIGIGERRAEPGLRLGALYEQQERWQAARGLYAMLLAQDPYLEGVRERLEALPMD